MLVGVAISDDGQKLAVSFPGESTWRGEDYGVVRIYAWDGSSWVQQGSDIYQPSNRASLNVFGWSLDFNDAGSGVLVGANNYAVIYEWDGTDWAESAQLGGRQAYVEWRGDYVLTGEDYVYLRSSTGWDRTGMSSSRNPNDLAETVIRGGGNDGRQSYRMLDRSILYRGLGTGGLGGLVNFVDRANPVSNGISWGYASSSMDARGSRVVITGCLTPVMSTVVYWVLLMSGIRLATRVSGRESAVCWVARMSVWVLMVLK